MQAFAVFLTNFQPLLAQVHMCMVPITNTFLDIWMKITGDTQKNRTAIVFLVTVY